MKILRQTKDFTVYQLAIRGTLLQWLSDALNIPEDKVEEALQSKCFTEARIDEILKNFEENKENTARGWGNFFPTQEEGELSLVKIDWSSGWNRNRYPLGHPNVWVGEARLVLASSLDESTQVEAGNNALPPKRKESKKTANECACMKAIKIKDSLTAFGVEDHCGCMKAIAQIAKTHIERPDCSRCHTPIEFSGATLEQHHDHTPEEVELTEEGTPLARFQKARTDAMIRMFNRDGNGMCGQLHTTSKLYAELDKSFSDILASIHTFKQRSGDCCERCLGVYTKECERPDCSRCHTSKKTKQEWDGRILEERDYCVDIGHGSKKENDKRRTDETWAEDETRNPDVVKEALEEVKSIIEENARFLEEERGKLPLEPHLQYAWRSEQKIESKINEILAYLRARDDV